MDKWECIVCGYIYDPQEGDPDDWVCPECGVEKDMFEKVE